METGRGYRTAQPVWLGGIMDFDGRPPAYVKITNNSFINYDGRFLPFGNDILDHYDLINNRSVFEWSVSLQLGGHEFGIKVRQRPLYFSPDNNYEVLMVDNFGSAARWNYAITQDSYRWGRRGIRLDNPNAIELSGIFSPFAVFELLAVGYHEEPAGR
jgi:hypothetical protein